MLVFEVMEATGIPPMDYHNASCDPYVMTLIGTRVYKTPVVRKNLTPVWNHQFRILLHQEQLRYDVTFQLWDWDRIKDDFFGSVTMSLSSITSRPSNNEWLYFELPYELQLKKRKKLLKKIVGVKGPQLLKVRAKYLTKELMEEIFWKGVVEFFDLDKSGFIEIDELQALFEGLNVEPESGNQINVTPDLVNDLDENKDGKITTEELVQYVRKLKKDQRELLPSDEMIWQTFLVMEEGTNIGDVIITQWQFSTLDFTKSLETPSEADKKKLKQILVQERNGTLTIELIPSYIQLAMKLMYNNKLGRRTTEGKKVGKILKKMSFRQGRIYDSPESRKYILPFIQFHSIPVPEMLESVESFQTFNQFFYRKLRPGARMVAEIYNDEIVVSPADCRLHVYPSIKDSTTLWIKGKDFSINSLLQDPELAIPFRSGSIVIARLAPQDYHRFHSPVSGRIGEIKWIPGNYFTVNPIAINNKIDVYCTNSRAFFFIETRLYGQVCFVAIGATMVGSINFTVQTGQEVRKGDELGFFAFGGSTCIVLFRRGCIEFDHDLLLNSAKPIETLVKCNEAIAKKIYPPVATKVLEFE